MEIISKDIFLDKKSELTNFYFVGDAHYGARAFDRGHFEKTISHIKKDKNGYVFLMGDLAECYNIGDKNFDTRSLDRDCLPHLDDLARFQVEQVTKMLAPIADKCLVLLDGNHEDNQRRFHQIDFNWRLRDNLKKLGGDPTWGSDIAAVVLRMRYLPHKNTRSFTFVMAHGFGGGRTEGGKLLRLQDLMKIMPGKEGYFTAHVHEKYYKPKSYLDVKERRRGTNGVDLIQKKVLNGTTGCFFKTYEKGQSNYASKKLYSPSDLGAIVAPIQAFYGTNGDDYRLDIRDLIL